MAPKPPKIPPRPAKPAGADASRPYRRGRTNKPAPSGGFNIIHRKKEELARPSDPVLAAKFAPRQPQPGRSEQRSGGGFSGSRPGGGAMGRGKNRMRPM